MEEFHILLCFTLKTDKKFKYLNNHSNKGKILQKKAAFKKPTFAKAALCYKIALLDLWKSFKYFCSQTTKIKYIKIIRNK